MHYVNRNALNQTILSLELEPYLRADSQAQSTGMWYVASVSRPGSGKLGARRDPFEDLQPTTSRCNTGDRRDEDDLSHSTDWYDLTALSNPAPFDEEY